MPTGYTADVADGKITTLKEYALACSRAFGALITMRDDPYDTPIPTHFVADTAYYDEGIGEAQNEIALILLSTEAELEAKLAKRNKEVLEYREQRFRKNEDIRGNYLAMIAKVEEWQGAPEGVKEFMLRQLVDSLEFDVSDDPLKYCEDVMTLEDWVADELQSLHDRIETYTKSRDEEIIRVEGRNEWLDQFHKSLENIT